MNDVVKSKKVYIFLGPPGSGKGTISNLFVKRLGWKQLSTGNLCRQHIAEKTEIGKKIDFDIKSGKLINDSLITEMVKNSLYQTFEIANSVILDGFPRTVIQAKSLHSLLNVPPFDSVLLNIIKLNITDQVLVDRLSRRVICQNDKCQAVYSTNKGSILNPKQDALCDECSSPIIKRSDDENESVIQRINIYRKSEDDLFNFYSKQGLTIQNIEVEQSVEKIYDDLIKMLGL